MTNYETIIYDKSENVAWITLNRPEVRNAISDTMVSELIQALEDARDDSTVRVIVLTGAGNDVFCAGADVKKFLDLSAADQLARHWRPSPILAVRNIPKPVIAMVNGLAYGGGCELVLSCDMAIASDNAKFGQLEILVGLMAGAGATQILPRLIGEKKTKELLYTGRTLTASEALNIGLINQVVPQAELREATNKLVATLCKRSPIILKVTKMAVNRSLETTLSAGLATERDLFAILFSTDDQKEGIRAFLEKREPHYEGK